MCLFKIKMKLDSVNFYFVMNQPKLTRFAFITEFTLIEDNYPLPSVEVGYRKFSLSEIPITIIFEKVTMEVLFCLIFDNCFNGLCVI